MGWLEGDGALLGRNVLHEHASFACDGREQLGSNGAADMEDMLQV
jgi:hypothetical protein